MASIYFQGCAHSPIKAMLTLLSSVTHFGPPSKPFRLSQPQNEPKAKRTTLMTISLNIISLELASYNPSPPKASYHWIGSVCRLCCSKEEISLTPRPDPLLNLRHDPTKKLTVHEDMLQTLVFPKVAILLTYFQRSWHHKMVIAIEFHYTDPEVDRASGG